MFLVTKFLVWLGVVLTTMVGIFCVKRYLLFRRFIQNSRIPFLRIEDCITGSGGSLLRGKSTVERIDRFFRSKGDTYGFFVGPVPYIMTKDLDLIYLLWVKESHKHINRCYLGTPLNYVNSSLLQARDGDWRRTRRVIGSVMTPLKLKAANVELDVQDCLSNMMDSLNRRQMKQQSEDSTAEKSLVVDCCHLFKTFTMDAFLRVGFDQSDMINYDLEENAIVNSAKEIMKKTYHPLCRLTLCIHELKAIVGFYAKLTNAASFADKLVSIVDKIVDDISNEEVEVDRSRKKMIHSMLDQYKAGKISRLELSSNTFFMLMAGWDTTGDTLTAIMWELANNERVQEKLRQEVIKDGMESQYLEWVIKETLRSHPPVDTGREIAEDFKWKGYNMMKGMFVAMSNYCIQRDKTIWGEDALDFKPERFEKSAQFHPAQFLAFGLGPRNCVGYHLAMYELKAVTVRFLLKYRISFNADSPKKLKLKSGENAVFFVNILQDPVTLKLINL